MSGTQPRILMVEDRPDLADLYQLKLQLEGYRVAVAPDGRAGLELARSLHPDAILLDVHLPEMDGLQLLSALRADSETETVPVIVFSDDDSPELIDEAVRLKCSAYLVKARLLPSDLAVALARALNDRGALAGAGEVKAEAS